ncbi:MAG: thioredoxin family protein [Cyclobacteriaceae bacterium]|nr:thioredoxin family protein [Cyclobacteriaceae bacterium]
MKKLKFAIMAALIFACSAPINQETVNFEDETILIGKVNWEGLTKPPFNDWFRPNYMHYVVDSTVLKALKGKLNDIEIVVFLGTWCSDSQQEVPEFYKIMDYLQYDVNKMEVVALEKLEDKRMVSPQHEEEGYGITHVPTFIFKRKGKEIGRITEYPEKTLEKDMVGIISN